MSIAETATERQVAPGLQSRALSAWRERERQRFEATRAAEEDLRRRLLDALRERIDSTLGIEIIPAANPVQIDGLVLGIDTQTGWGLHLYEPCATCGGLTRRLELTAGCALEVLGEYLSQPRAEISCGCDGADEGWDE